MKVYKIFFVIILLLAKLQSTSSGSGYDLEELARSFDRSTLVGEVTTHKVEHTLLVWSFATTFAS